MKTLVIINTNQGGILFSLLYIVAFITAAGIMIFQGVKKGYPLTSWLMILVSGVVFFIIGDKVFTYSSDQWLRVFTEFGFPAAVEKNALGGIIGLFAGIFIARIVLRFNRPVFDTLAIGLLVAIAISRIGCLMAGCCFGTPTTLPLGIKYDAASMAYHAQLVQGLINNVEPGSLAIHPVQLYQVAGCLLIAFIVWWTRNQWRTNGSLFLFSVLCYCFMRFFTEFLCDPASNSFAYHFLWGMNLVQWMIIAAFAPGLITLILRETKAKPGIKYSLPVKVSEFRLVILTLLLCMLVFLGRNWFDFLEFATITMFFIPVVILMLVEIYRNHSVAGFRWAAPVLLICCFSFMAQKSNPDGKENDIIKFTELGFSAMIGSYYDNMRRVTGESCGSYTTVPVGTDKRTFFQGGIDLSYNIWRGKYNKLSVGGQVFVGSETGEIRTEYPHSEFTYGISPYLNINWRWFGLGTGFTIGQMKLTPGLAVEFSSSQFSPGNNYPELTIGNIISANYLNRNLVLSSTVRVGPYDIFYMEGSYPGMFPSTTPFPSFQVGFGSGLGKTNGTKAAIGVCDDGFYTELNYPFKNNVVLKAYYADNFYSGTRSKRVLSLGITYRIFPEKSSSSGEIK